MDVLWQSSVPLKPAQVLEKLDHAYAYTTIMTVLKRMVDKKVLKRKLNGKVYYYCPVSCKQKFVESNLQNIYGDLVSSYGEVAISNFVDVLKNNKKDLEMLKAYLAKHK